MVKLDFFPKISAGDILRKFLFYFSLGLGAAVAILWLIARMEEERMYLLLTDHERSHLQQVQYAVSQDLALLATDLLRLTESDPLKDFLATSTPAALVALNTRLRYFVEDRGNYNRLSLLDPAGRELARVGSPFPEVEPVSAKEGVEQQSENSRGNIAVVVRGGGDDGSPPVLSLSTAVFDVDGHQRGMLVLDCRIEKLLGRALLSFPEGDRNRLLVVDDMGYPIKTPAVGTDEDRLLATEWPDIRQVLPTRPSGQVNTPKGLFTFAIISPVLAIGMASVGHGMGDEDGSIRPLGSGPAWHLALFTPVPEISPFGILRQGSHFIWLVLLGGIVLATGSLHLAINRANRERSDRAVGLLSIAIEQSPAAALITDRDGLIRYANQKFLTMSGYSREELVGQNPRLLKSGDTPVEVYRDLWQTIRAGQVWSGEFRNRRKDATQYIVSAKISPIFRRSGVIGGFLAIQEDITETRRLQQQLERLATIDGLTGINNRSHFLYLFTQELRREERYGQPLCLLVLDIDHFKVINDTFGHPVGDRVLEEFARVVSSTLRDTDIFGRLGGEEFGVVLLQTDLDGAKFLAERLRNEVEEMRINSGEHDIRVTVSIGGTRWERVDHQVEVLLNRADNALYEAKRTGRNQVCFRLGPVTRDGD